MILSLSLAHAQDPKPGKSVPRAAQGRRVPSGCSLGPSQSGEVREHSRPRKALRTSITVPVSHSPYLTSGNSK